MKITKEKLIELNACEPIIPWFEANGSEDLLTTLIAVNKCKPEWARRIFSRLMSHKQRVEIAIFCAEKVIDIFEKKYPDDKRPRKAIESARAWLENPTKENRKYAYAAAYAADAADAAAYAACAAAYAADAADAAAYAACAAAYAADAAAYAADAVAYAAAAAAYAADARLKLQEEIIHEAVRILDRDETGGK